MLSLLVFFCLFLSSSALTQCTDSLGPGDGLPCPPPNIVTDDNLCCTPGGVQTVGVPAGGATTTLSPGVTTSFIGGNVFTFATAGINTFNNCVDLVNPQTGVSDCPARASLCNDPTYHAVMTQQCPRTCGKCSSALGSGIGGAANCQDLLNPRTGVSDCPSNTALCNDANYQALMAIQCPRTCGRCNGASTVSGTGFTSGAINGNCVDRINSNTGTSDCPSRASLCTNPQYTALMMQQCPRTCGFCSSTASTSYRGVAATTSSTIAGVNCVDAINPSTGTSDCPARASLCNNSQYAQLMRTQCPATCGFCSG